MLDDAQQRIAAAIENQKSIMRAIKDIRDHMNNLWTVEQTNETLIAFGVASKAYVSATESLEWLQECQIVQPIIAAERAILRACKYVKGNRNA